MVQQRTWSGRERSSHSCLEPVPKSGSPLSTCGSFVPAPIALHPFGRILLCLRLIRMGTAAWQQGLIDEAFPFFHRIRYTKIFPLINAIACAIKYWPASGAPETFLHWLGRSTSFKPCRMPWTNSGCTMLGYLPGLGE